MEDVSIIASALPPMITDSKITLKMSEIWPIFHFLRRSKAPKISGSILGGVLYSFDTWVGERGNISHNLTFNNISYTFWHCFPNNKRVFFIVQRSNNKQTMEWNGVLLDENAIFYYVLFGVKQNIVLTFCVFYFMTIKSNKVKFKMCHLIHDRYQ